MLTLKKIKVWKRLGKDAGLGMEMVYWLGKVRLGMLRLVLLAI